MTWTNISKPTGVPYTYVNPQGKETYDQANITYDQIGIYYDGVNASAWASVAKPADGRYIFPGMATGVLGPPTYSKAYDASSWVKITKPLD